MQRAWRVKLFVVLVLMLALGAGCSKPGDDDGGGGGNTIPKINSYSPSTVNTGSIVTLTGENFGTNLSQVTVVIGTLSFQPSSVNGNTIVFTVPANLLSSGSQVFNVYVVINGVNSNTIQLTINFVVVQPKGWFYINKDMIDGVGIPREMFFYDDPYQFGLAFGNGILESTTNDGASWGGIWPGNHWGSGFHVFDDDEAWIETNIYDVWVYNYDYFNASSRYARLDTITTIPALKNKALTGLYVTKRNRGYVLTHDGSVLKINGSFAPSAISLEYQPNNYTSLPLTFQNNAYYAMEGLDSNNLIIAGRPEVNGVMSPRIVLKRNGAYQEYNFTVNDIGYPYRLQFPDANNIFFLSLNYELWKYSAGSNSFVKLNTPKFDEICFLNGNLGYASGAWAPGVDNYNIYKTVDGGNTWTLDFAMDPFHYAYTMCTRNGKVWVIGEHMGSHRNFMLKFNP